MAGGIEAFQSQDVERFVAFINPVSQHTAQIQQQIKDMEGALDLQAECVYSTASPEETYERLVAQVLPKLGEGTLLTVFGGDGLANQATKALVGDSSTYDSREATVFFSDNGNANDTGRSLIPPKFLQKPGKLLERSDLVIAEAHPLNAEFETSTGRQSEVVLSYLGVGSDAEGALALNQAKPKMRAVQKYLGKVVGGAVQTACEPGIVLRAAVSSPQFDIKEDDAHNRTEYTDCIEFLIGNGTRMAKYFRWSLTSLLEESMQVAVCDSRFTGALRAPTIIANALRLTCGQLSTEYDNGFAFDGSAHTRAWKIQNIQRADKPLRIQFDGETAEIEEGRLEVSQTPSLRVLTQRPHGAGPPTALSV